MGGLTQASGVSSVFFGPFFFALHTLAAPNEHTVLAPAVRGVWRTVSHDRPRDHDGPARQDIEKKDIVVMPFALLVLASRVGSLRLMCRGTGGGLFLWFSQAVEEPGRSGQVLADKHMYASLGSNGMRRMFRSPTVTFVALLISCSVLFQE